MSDYSHNASIESPASPNLDLPLPVPPPQVSIDMDLEFEYHVSTPSPTPSTTLAESVLPEGCISPQSALAILQAFGTGGNADNLREVAQITARTLFQRTQAYEATIQRLQDDIAVMRARTATTPVTPRIAPRPQGFLPNNGRLLHFYIPHLGGRARARFIRKCSADPTMAEGTMGGTGAEVYTYPLEALPPYDASGDNGENRASEPLLQWLLDLCKGLRPPFALSSVPAKAPATGGCPPTSHDTGPPSTGSTSSTQLARVSSTASTAVGKTSTSSPVDWVGQRRRADLPTYSTLRTLSRWSPEPPTASGADAGEVGSPVVGLRSNRRVMSRSTSSQALPSVEHSYLFCPREDPAEYHAGC